MAQSALGAITLPGDVYAGRVDPLSDEGIGRSADLAGLIMTGTFGGAPAGALGSGPVRGRTGSFSMDYFGRPVRVLQNPSPKELQGFIGRTKYKAARRISDPETGDVFVWDAADPALHQMMAEQLGIKYDGKGDIIGSD